MRTRQAGMRPGRACGGSLDRSCRFQKAERGVGQTEGLQIFQQLRATLVTHLEPPVHQLIDDQIEPLRDVGVCAPRRWKLTRLLRFQDFHVGFAAKGGLTCQKGVEHAAERVEVAAVVDVLGVARLFRRHVYRRAGAHAGARQHDVFPVGLGQPHVCYFYHPFFGNQDVVRLDVPMDDPLLVGMFQSARAGDDHVERVADGELAEFSEPRLHAAAVDILHGAIVKTVGFADTVTAHDVGVIEPGHDTRLALEALDELRIRGQVPGEHLDGGVAVQAELACHVDRAHAAGAELSGELEIAQGAHLLRGNLRALLWRRCLYRRGLQQRVQGSRCKAVWRGCCGRRGRVEMCRLLAGRESRLFRQSLDVRRRGGRRPPWLRRCGFFRLGDQLALGIGGSALPRGLARGTGLFLHGKTSPWQNIATGRAAPWPETIAVTCAHCPPSPESIRTRWPSLESPPRRKACR